MKLRQPTSNPKKENRMKNLNFSLLKLETFLLCCTKRNMNLFKENQEKPKTIFLQSGCNPSFPRFFYLFKIDFYSKLWF